jgi:hypothetical protein
VQKQLKGFVNRETGAAMDENILTICFARRVATYKRADLLIDLQADAMEALALMTRTASSRLMVTEGNRLAGIISLKDMMKFFELKVELEPSPALGQASPLLRTERTEHERI